MGEPIEFPLPASIHAKVDETYRLVSAFVRIPSGAWREEVIALAEAGAGLVASAKPRARRKKPPCVQHSILTAGRDASD